MMKQTTFYNGSPATPANTEITQHKTMIAEICEWAIMNGIAFKQVDLTARHCPFSLAPVSIERQTMQKLLNVVPHIATLVSRVSEDHAFLKDTLNHLSQADPFFEHLLKLHHNLHFDGELQTPPPRQPLLIMRTDFMDDRHQGAKVIEFNAIAAGMGPFGQKASELHHYIQQQWPSFSESLLEHQTGTLAENNTAEQLALGIFNAASSVRAHFAEDGAPHFLMIVQSNEDNVYDQHLLELALQQLGVRTTRRTFEQLTSELYSGEQQRLMLKDFGAIDVVYLRAGYQYSDYCAPQLDLDHCCYTLSQTRAFIEQHYVAVNATISQQLASSKSMQMALTMMDAQEYQRWGLTIEQAELVKSVLAEMKPVTKQSIHWFSSTANPDEWVLKNQGEGGGHCFFGSEISDKLLSLTEQEYNAWALMQRLFPHEREVPVIAVRDGHPFIIDDLVSEIGLFTVHYQQHPVTLFNGYAGYLVRSKPAHENEGGIHSGKGILDSLVILE